MTILGVSFARFRILIVADSDENHHQTEFYLNKQRATE